MGKVRLAGGNISQVRSASKCAGDLQICEGVEGGQTGVRAGGWWVSAVCHNIYRVMASPFRTHRRNKAEGHIEDHFRLTFNPLAPDSARSSLASQDPPTFRSSDISGLTSRPLRLPSRAKPHPPRQSSLLSTLQQLEGKLSEARRELKLGREAVGTGRRQEKEEGMEKTEESTLNLESQKRLGRRVKERAAQVTLKGYYLSEVARGVAGLNPRALEHLQLSHQIIKSCHGMSLPDDTIIPRLQVRLPLSLENFGKKVLVLDLDETLVHCGTERSSPDDIEVDLGEEEGGKGFVSLRPYALSFLQKARLHFEVVAFTASEKSYADAVLDEMDPERRLIAHRLYREHCVRLQTKVYAKDLRVLGRELSQVLLVDNSPLSHLYQLDNGVPILPYTGGEDSELLQLERYLERARGEADVRVLNRKTFRLHNYPLFEDCEQLVTELYARPYY